MKEKIDSEKAPAALGPYSQAIKANGFLFVSGQLPLDVATGKLVEGDIKTLTNKVIDNLEAILKKAESSLDKVVSVQVFLIDLKEDFKEMNEAYALRFNSGVAPARVTVEVSALPMGARVEIACTAY